MRWTGDRERCAFLESLVEKRRILPDVIRTWVFVSVFAGGGAATASPPLDIHVHNYQCLTEQQVRRAVDAVQACRSDGRANGVRILMSRGASGALQVTGFQREPEAGDDRSLDPCLRRVIDALKLATSCTDPEATLTLSWPATAARASNPRTLADDDRALCVAAERLLAAGDVSRPLQRLALAFTESHPSQSGLEVMREIDRTPAPALPDAWMRALKARGVQAAPCAALRKFVGAPPR
jgi:hypothetical protein